MVMVKEGKKMTSIDIKRFGLAWGKEFYFGAIFICVGGISLEQGEK
jgi:hypothetical protein